VLTDRDVGADLPDENVLVADGDGGRTPLIVFDKRRCKCTALHIDDVSDYGVGEFRHRSGFLGEALKTPKVGVPRTDLALQ